MRKIGTRANFVISIVALIIAVVGCTLAVWMFFFQPAPLTQEKATALIEEKTKPYLTEEKVKKIVEEAVAGLKPAAAEEGKE